MKPRFYYVPEDTLAHLRAADLILAAEMERIGGFDLKPSAMKSVFAALMRSIVYQQLNGKAAEAILNRVLKVLKPYGGAKPEAIEKVCDAEMRGAGLSAAKLLAIRDLARKSLDGTVPTVRQAHALTDEELVERLTQVRGIGPWTVHMLLIFYLGRPDVLPTGDYAVRAAFQKLYRKRKHPKPAVLEKHARKWRPYRSVASWYLWRSLDTQL